MADDSPSSARVIPKRKDFSWVSFQSPVGRAGLASIRARYGGSGPTDDVPIGQTFPAGRPDNPNIVNPVAVPNPLFEGDMETQSALGISPTVAPVSTAPPITQTVPSGRPDGPQPLVNPNTGATVEQEEAASAKRDFMARGGSEATYRASQVARGIGPAIDARGGASGLNSTAANDIRAGWGWAPSVTTGSQGAPIAAEMTKNFIAAGSRSGDQNANWNKKFKDARSQLQASLKS